ncbi:aldo/keto reductase [Acetilactobacillus jinshanensis]|uniref:Aldo/keto reductase n=1 Tax=Acetilactobacillus jinshanensis TaxID=1720083 RepID=A0A4P6ZJN3_9LACO|nr:aldo/keto reductase [Acetilactobacillus jinshanensis]QBP17743.1 aldo/keto reductase [Acetilactobacillus jinshanensis]URL60606.1 aldo/keto reductase [uncultured bacterium]
MPESLKSTTELNNGVMMPRLGLGVWKTDNSTAKNSVKNAIEHGYHLIDTAKQYGNEYGVGQGIKEAIAETGINRKDLFITSKLYNGDQGYATTLHAIKGTLKRLGLSYLDLYIMHWPVDGKYIDTWRAMEKLYHEGLVRAIGISNFDVPRMKNLLAHSTVTPAVNQMEFNPINQEKKVIAFDNWKGIQTEAWSPLGGGEALGNKAINKIAKKHGKSAAQVILRWDWDRGIVTIPKSAHEKRIVQNSQIFDFQLTDDEINAINNVDQEKRALWYDNFKWHSVNAPYTDEVDHWDDSPKDWKE